MIFFYSICGVGVVAVGLAISELIRKPRKPGISGKSIDEGKARLPIVQAPYFGGDYLPPPGDDRPRH